jgi:hypothetical protein
MNLKPFRGRDTLTQRADHYCQSVEGRLEIATKKSLVKPGSQFRDAQGGQSARTMFGPSFYSTGDYQL